MKLKLKMKLKNHKNLPPKLNNSIQIKLKANSGHSNQNCLACDRDNCLHEHMVNVKRALIYLHVTRRQKVCFSIFVFIVPLKPFKRRDK